MSSLLDFFSSTAGVIAAVVFAVLVVATLAVILVRKRRSDQPELGESVEAAAPVPKPPSAQTIPDEVSAETETPEPAAPDTLEQPEPVRTRMQRLRARMARSGAIGNALLSVFSRSELSEADWEEIEDALLIADVGIVPTEQIMNGLRTEARVRGSLKADEAREVLRKQLLDLVDPQLDRSLNLDPITTETGELGPAAVLVVGVNGTGKTTTVGKMARLLRAEDKTVVLGAADTFRAAAAEQLTTWGDRVGVPVISSQKEGGDPASVAFDAVKQAVGDKADVVIVDTAGRLQTKATLMEELGKIRRVMERQVPVKEVLLVLDATTGQNGMRQAQVFSEAVGITGIVLTKLDGSAKGGIVIAVQKELGVPVKLVGLGEGPDDLAPFDPVAFVDAIVGG